LDIAVATPEKVDTHDVESIMRVALKRNPHWFVHRTFVIIPPVDHFVRGFRFDYFDSNGIIHIRSWVLALYEDNGKGICSSSPGQSLRSARSPKIAQRIAEWCEEEFSHFGWVSSPHTYVEYIRKVTGSLSTYYANRLPPYSYALAGRLSRARYLAAAAWQEGDRDRTFEVELREELAAAGENPLPSDTAPSLAEVRRRRRLLDVLKGGQAHADAMLRTFESINVRKLGLEAHWTSPWPERRWRRGPQPT
jgi:hypothetical protein